MSEISVEDEVNCSSFVIPDVEPKWNLIFEDSIKFEQFVENRGLKNMKEKAIVFPKVKSTPNQFFVIKRNSQI